MADGSFTIRQTFPGQDITNKLSAAVYKKYVREVDYQQFKISCSNDSLVIIVPKEKLEEMKLFSKQVLDYKMGRGYKQQKADDDTVSEGIEEEKG